MPEKTHTADFTIRTNGKGTLEITSEVEKIVAEAGVSSGVATVFVCHTSCSLVIMENADPSARHDLHEFFERLVPEDTPYFVHTHEGADDMPSHVRMCLTGVDRNIPILNGRLVLGTWQGIFLFEHRRAPHRRRIVVHVAGS